VNLQCAAEDLACRFRIGECKSQSRTEADQTIAQLRRTRFHNLEKPDLERVAFTGEFPIFVTKRGVGCGMEGVCDSGRAFDEKPAGVIRFSEEIARVLDHHPRGFCFGWRRINTIL
jgi:hypothetical protein